MWAAQMRLLPGAILAILLLKGTLLVDVVVALRALNGYANCWRGPTGVEPSGRVCHIRLMTRASTACCSRCCAAASSSAPTIARPEPSEIPGWHRMGTLCVYKLKGVVGVDYGSNLPAADWLRA